MSSDLEGHPYRFHLEYSARQGGVSLFTLGSLSGTHIINPSY